MARALADGAPYGILDGKISETDRLAETATIAKGEDIDAWYSGKAHRPGASGQPVMLPRPPGPDMDPETACSAASAARENEDSPCSPSAGPPSSASPRRTIQTVQAALVLTQFEHKYIS